MGAQHLVIAVGAALVDGDVNNWFRSRCSSTVAQSDLPVTRSHSSLVSTGSADVSMRNVCRSSGRPASTLCAR
jgi:hypothetical protein